MPTGSSVTGLGMMHFASLGHIYFDVSEREEEDIDQVNPVGLNRPSRYWTTTEVSPPPSPPSHVLLAPVMLFTLETIAKNGLASA